MQLYHRQNKAFILKWRKQKNAPKKEKKRKNKRYHQKSFFTNREKRKEKQTDDHSLAILDGTRQAVDIMSDTNSKRTATNGSRWQNGVANSNGSWPTRQMLGESSHQMQPFSTVHGIVTGTDYCRMAHIRTQKHTLVRTR